MTFHLRFRDNAITFSHSRLSHKNAELFENEIYRASKDRINYISLLSSLLSQLSRNTSKCFHQPANIITDYFVVLGEMTLAASNAPLTSEVIVLDDYSEPLVGLENLSIGSNTPGVITFTNSSATNQDNIFLLPSLNRMVSSPQVSANAPVTCNYSTQQFPAQPLITVRSQLQSTLTSTATSFQNNPNALNQTTQVSNFPRPPLERSHSAELPALKPIASPQQAPKTSTSQNVQIRYELPSTLSYAPEHRERSQSFDGINQQRFIFVHNPNLPPTMQFTANQPLQNPSSPQYRPHNINSQPPRLQPMPAQQKNTAYRQPTQNSPAHRQSSQVSHQSLTAYRQPAQSPPAYFVTNQSPTMHYRPSTSQSQGNLQTRGNPSDRTSSNQRDSPRDSSLEWRSGAREAL